MNKSVKKSLVAIIILLILLLAFGMIYVFSQKGEFSPKAATAGVTLSLSPNSANQIINTNFDVNILLNTNNQPTVGTDVILTYNTQDLSIVDADTNATGTQIKPGSLYYSYPVNSVDTTNGKINFSGIIQPGGSNYSGSGVLATITFRALRVQASSHVNFSFSLDATNDSNVTSPTGSDLLYSVTNGTYNLVPPDVTFNFTENLQGRTNYSATGASLKIYNLNTTTNVYTNSNLTANSSGSGQITISGLSSANYDYQLKIPYFLSTKVSNKLLTNPMTIAFGTQKSGDLNNDNIVNTIDFAILSSKWTLNDAISDINQDGIVNTVDFALLNSNWLIQGQ